jgi:polar amino acid transport system substrate-binding protein
MSHRFEFLTPAGISELAPEGRIRAAINFGNPILATRDKKTQEPGGVSVDLAHRLAELTGMTLEFVLYDAAGAVVAGGERGEWDVAFVARDPLRAKGIAQTRPYLLIEGGYLVPEDSPIRSNEEVDREGTRVVVGKGSAYDLFLSRELRHATIIRSATSPEVVELMIDGQYEVAAGVKQQLEFDASRLSKTRILPGRFMVIEQAMGTPKGRDAAAALLERFIADSLESGFVADAVSRHGILGATVAR